MTVLQPSPRSPGNGYLVEERRFPFSNSSQLFLASFLTLYFEVLVIRYLTAEVRVFANLKNFPLIASFFGIGLGIMLGASSKSLRRALPLIVILLFLPIRFASQLHLPSVDISWNYGLSSGSVNLFWRAFYALRLVAVVFYFLTLIVALFVVLGGFVGEHLKRVSPLKGYGINLAGSLLGMAVFATLSFVDSGPAIWLSVGFLFLLPFFVRQYVTLALLVVAIAAVAIPQSGALWSPYYRIDFVPMPSPEGSSHPSAYSLAANHSWYQWVVDLSPAFLKSHPEAKPNSFLFPQYELPYEIVPSPRNVLILGAGTGNDVAAALRHGAEHIDAVELDPVILRLGKRYHPEHPYSSTNVTLHVDDARAFLKKSKRKYDLIIFAFLDSSILLSGFSSLRLDNYVYTLESFQSARALLSDNGTLVLSFATARSFATYRLYATLEKAFAMPPAAYLMRYYVNGVLMVEGAARGVKIPELPDVSRELQARTDGTIIATDDWPFLYLETRSIPASIVVVAPLFILAAWKVLQKTGLLAGKASPAYWHFFFLGAGFLLLETKAVTELSLLFGSTWAVNSIVIGSFLIVALLSNVLVGVWSISARLCYWVLFLLLALNLFHPYSLLDQAGLGAKLLMGGGWVALPVFFAGIIFSGSLKNFGGASEALGINMFGAVCGGIVENAMMVGGTRLLAWLAIALYALSAYSLFLARGAPHQAA
jgi:spermine/spermidine synthase